MELMEISFLRRSCSFLQLAMKTWHRGHFKYMCRKITTVEVAHKIYGNLDGNIPIIILHGLLGSKRNWNSMSEKLRTACNRVVIAVDMRNHGDSPHSPSHLYPELAADIKRLMEKLMIKEAIVIGHSMGGRTAMVLAVTEPRKVSHLIVVDISPVSSPSILNNFFPQLIDVMKTITFDDAKDVSAAKEMAKEKLKNSKIKEDMDSGFINFVLMNIGQKDGKIVWKCNMDALKKNFVNIASFPPEVAGKVYEGPTLFIAGDQSHFVPKGDLEAIKEIFPLALMVIVENAGHNVHADKPDVFVELVKALVSISL